MVLGRIHYTSTFNKINPLKLLLGVLLVTGQARSQLHAINTIMK